MMAYGAVFLLQGGYAGWTAMQWFRLRRSGSR